ncbi:hypothetical protein FCV25MIE_15974 [Fagus crenata]
MASSSQLSEIASSLRRKRLADVEDDDVLGERTNDNVEDDMVSLGLESDIPIHGFASVEATPLFSDVLEGLHSVIVEQISSVVDQTGSVTGRRELVPLEDVGS